MNYQVIAGSLLVGFILGLADCQPDVVSPNFVPPTAYVQNGIPVNPQGRPVSPTKEKIRQGLQAINHKLSHGLETTKIIGQRALASEAAQKGKFHLRKGKDIFHKRVILPVKDASATAAARKAQSGSMVHQSQHMEQPYQHVEPQYPQHVEHQHQQHVEPQYQQHVEPQYQQHVEPQFQQHVGQPKYQVDPTNQYQAETTHYQEPTHVSSHATYPQTGHVSSSPYSTYESSPNSRYPSQMSYSMESGRDY